MQPRLSCPLPREAVPPVRHFHCWARRTAGEREALLRGRDGRADCLAGSGAQGIVLLRVRQISKDRPLMQAETCARETNDCRADGLLSTQVVVKQAKDLYAFRDCPDQLGPGVLVNASQPYEPLSVLATTKKRRK